MRHVVTAVFAIVILLTLSAGSVSAHHSFAATYLEGQTQKIEGKVVQFLFRNPHSFLHVEAPDEKGNMQVWNIEWGGLRIGVCASLHLPRVITRAFH